MASTVFNKPVDDEIATLNSNITSLYKVETYFASVSANTETNVEISPPSGYTKGAIIGLYGNNSWTDISIITIASSGTDYPNRIRVKSSSAQTVYAKILWFR